MAVIHTMLFNRTIFSPDDVGDTGEVEDDIEPLPFWFRFEVFREWIDHSLDETLGRKWETPTNDVKIPTRYGQLETD